MKNNKILVKNPDIVDRLEEKEALLFDPASGGMMCVNSTGIFIWEKCDGTRTSRDIVRAIESEYEVDHDVAEKDYEIFLSKLEKKGFVGYKV